MSFNPKKTSTQVRGGGARKRGGVAKKRVSSGRPVVVTDADSEEEEEEDVDLLSLLEPSGRVSRLVGLSQLARPSDRRTSSDVREGGTKKKSAIRPPGASGDTRSTTTNTARNTARKPTNTATKPTNTTTKPTNTTSKTTNTTTRKTAKKSSRKSVAFNPHTTNLGSPELPSAPRPAASPGSDSGGGVYDYVPSDEEDLSHSKARLYSPRKKSNLKKSAASSTTGRKNEKSSRGRGTDEGTGSETEEMRQEVGGARKEGESVRELSIRVEDISSGVQWFVPDNLTLHQIISEKSPRSLQRLTRSGRKPSDTSSLVAPGKKQRRPRELDSTVETRAEREGDSASQSGGASSSDEPNLASSSKSRRHSKSRLVVMGGKRGSRRRSSGQQQSSVERRRKQKRATPPSDTVLTEEEEEEGTPSKKTRVSTPEEDEGMQSGGPLLLSSSDEGESQELVRSLGGRRYRRYVVEHQDTRTPGVRRSKRSRVAPVQHWRNEEPEYERRRSGTVCVCMYSMVSGVCIL